MTQSFAQYLASIRVPTPDAPEAVSADMLESLLSRPFPDDAVNNYAARLIRDGAIFVPGGSK